MPDAFAPSAEPAPPVLAQLATRTANEPLAEPVAPEAAPAALLTIRGRFLTADGTLARLRQWLLPKLDETGRVARGSGTIDLDHDTFEITVDENSLAVALVARNTVLGMVERIDAPAILRTGGIVEGDGRSVDFEPEMTMAVEPSRLPSTNVRGSIRYRVVDEDVHEIVDPKPVVRVGDEWNLGDFVRQAGSGVSRNSRSQRPLATLRRLSRFAAGQRPCGAR